MVVRLVLEQVQPVLIFPVHVHLHLHGAGVDLLGLVQTGQDALRLQPARPNGAHVHEAHGLLVAAQIVAHRQIALEGGAHGLVLYLHVVQHGAERGVAAVVGPIRVDHLDLGDGGATPLLGEILLAERKVSQVHGQASVGHERRKARFVQFQKAIDGLYHRRLGIVRPERGTRLEGRLARLDRIDDVVLDGCDVFVREVAFQQVHRRAAHLGPLALADQLDALAGRVGALVELPGQVLHREHRGSARVRHLERRHIGLGLAEHRGHALLEQLV